jgi:hypothetical protein
MHVSSFNPIAKRRFSPLAAIAALCAALLWMVHPVVHAGENLHAHDGHAHSHAEQHQDVQCPLGSMRDQASAPQPVVSALLSPLVTLAVASPEYVLILTSTPVDSAALPRPPPALLCV